MNIITIGLLVYVLLVSYEYIKIIKNYYRKKNFPFILWGKEFWYSRSVAVTLFTFAYDKNGEKYVLANKRGKGTPDFQGKWNVPCGYLDFDESGENAAQRETIEETNITVPIEQITFVKVDTSPDANRQNVTITYQATLDDTIEDLVLSTEKSEKNEVEEIKWINIKEIDNYEWAFNHENIIKTLI